MSYTKEEMQAVRREVSGSARIALEHIGSVIDKKEAATLTQLRHEFRQGKTVDLSLVAKLVAYDDVRLELESQIRQGTINEPRK